MNCRGWDMAGALAMKNWRETGGKDQQGLEQPQLWEAPTDRPLDGLANGEKVRICVRKHVFRSKTSGNFIAIGAKNASTFGKMSLTAFGFTAITTFPRSMRRVLLQNPMTYSLPKNLVEFLS